jgi:hypothetical protein
MIPETWSALLRAYGFCERHSWIHLSVEMSFRDQHVLGPTIIYEALIDKALHAISGSPLLGTLSVSRRLRAIDRCMLCKLNIADSSPGASPRNRLDKARDNRQLRTFASRLKPLWSGTVCAACEGRESSGIARIACRRHLLAEMHATRPVDLSGQRNLLHDVYDRVTRYQRSLLAGGPAAGERDRAALITAIGWCSGWRPLLALLQ